MKKFLGLLFIVTVICAVAWVLRPTSGSSQRRTLTDLPWQVQPDADGTSKVFGLHLGRATLADAVAKFGPFEQMAVFADEAAKPVLEAYFGTVWFGPLKAKIITALAAEPQELSALIERSPERKGSPTGDWKYPVPPAARSAQLGRTIQALTFIPTYGGLGDDYFRERFGEPAAWKRVDEHAVQWFYPTQGVSLLLNSKGKEVLEFAPPRTMRLPEGVEYGDPSAIID